MKEIIAPVAVAEIMAELTNDKFIRKTNFGGNLIFSINYQNAPAVMREIGRLRELAFRKAGGGTGKEFDIDAFDTSAVPYQQLIVWDPEYQMIMGGYRYILLRDVERNEAGAPILATGQLFNFTDTFVNDFMPYTLELGRSFVHPEYQVKASGRKSLFALDNLWDGIGALTVDNHDVRYHFGKVTMYKSYNIVARDFLLYFMKHFCADVNKMLFPKESIEPETDVSQFCSLFSGADYLSNYKILIKQIRKFGENVPPLINAYLNISPTMRSFGTTPNNHFGGVEETGILITVKDIYDNKLDRHLKSYIKGEPCPALKL